MGVVFIDLKKAFDTVTQKILLQKLLHYGILAKKLQWFKSYLSNSSQFTRVNGIDSEIENINIGVPQGSCLGPLLFYIYINDPPYIVNTASVYIYADDTSLRFRTCNMSRLNEALNKDLEALDTWLKGNELSLNVAKMQSMFFSTKQKHAALKHQADKLNLHIRSNALETVQSTKYLGVHIDDSFNWKIHIKEISEKISRSLCLLKCAIRFLPFDSLKTFILALLTHTFAIV